MLRKLFIQNFVLIDKLELDFDKGFCVITGQTGAGKSILLASILFCFGAKPAGEILKAGTTESAISIEFDNCEAAKEYLNQNNIETDDIINIKSTQNEFHKRKFFIGDKSVSIKIIQALLPIMLEIHSQHHHTSLLDRSQHINIIDDYIKAGQIKSELKILYEEQRQLKIKQEEYRKIEQELEKDIDYLSYICAELEKADIKEAEEQKLIDAKNNLQSYDKRKNILRNLLQEISKIEIEQLVINMQRSETEFNETNNFEKLISHIDSAYDEIENAKSFLEVLLSEIEAPENSLEEIDDRLNEIRNLARKHNIASSQLGEFLKKSKNKLGSLLSQNKEAHDLDSQFARANEKYRTLALILSEKRKKGAEDLASKVIDELQFLDMKKAIFTVEVKSDIEKISASGIDEISFMVSTNPGSARGLIEKIASGGELARFMLALRVALFGNAAKRTIIFDEVDVGISGSVADAVGERLKMLSSKVQVITITHQPQVAGKADQHILVEKIQEQNHTISTVKLLKNHDKALEIARMISGKKITDIGVQAAKELLN